MNKYALTLLFILLCKGFTFSQICINHNLLNEKIYGNIKSIKEIYFGNERNCFDTLKTIFNIFGLIALQQFLIICFIIIYQCNFLFS